MRAILRALGIWRSMRRTRVGMAHYIGQRRFREAAALGRLGPACRLAVATAGRTRFARDHLSAALLI